MKSFYLRRSSGYVGFGRVSDALWPQFCLGWFTLEIWPSDIADRVENILRSLRP